MYPEYKQLNLLRTGTDQEIADMNTFIVLVGQDDCHIEWELEDINYIAGQKITSLMP